MYKELPTDNKPLLQGNRSPTSNAMGYVFFNISPIGQAFLDRECKEGKHVIDLGAGYSNIPIQALKNGVGRYIANDLSMDHLEILVDRIKDAGVEPELARLELLEGRIPDVLPNVNGVYDAILADKVIHFIGPEEILQFIHWAMGALKYGGALYVTVASPYGRSFAGLASEYLKRRGEGAEFPGYTKDVMSKVIFYPGRDDPHTFKLPDEMVFFTSGDLAGLFNKHGFKVIDSYAMVQDNDRNMWDICEEEKAGIVGIIAKKEG